MTYKEMKLAVSFN